MSSEKVCWGIYRESAHSPGRVGDDALLLVGVAEVLAERGFQVGLLAPEEFDDALGDADANIFAMCERRKILDGLVAAEGRGAVVINSPEAIRNTYRHRTIELFEEHGVPAPVSQVVATDASTPPPAGPTWIKRCDFHALDSSDVMYAASPDAWLEGLACFSKRGVGFAVSQEHIPGDLVKFYGVGIDAPDGDWFEWFYHSDKEVKGHPFDAVRLRNIARQAANVCGVEIFGGDAIVRPDGEPVIIDLNAWPSFARCRDRAATAIANHLAGRFERGRLVVAR